MNQTGLIIALVVGTLLSAGSAYGVNTLIATVAEPEGPPATNDPPALAQSAAQKARSRRKPMATGRRRTAEEYLDGIMSRNLFDESIIATWKPPQVGGEAAAEERVTPLRVKLLGTLVASPASQSSALIVDEDDHFPKGYSIGDVLQEREIVKIEQNRVTLRNPDGSEEILKTDQEIEPARPSRPQASRGDDDEAVEQVEDNRFQVSKDLFDKYINDLEGISRMGRALLHRGPDGEFDGYRLSAIRRNTLADQLGIKNGDIIHSVNGSSLDSVQSAMNAYNTLRTESNFCFEITRRGSPMELCYDVR